MSWAPADEGSAVGGMRLVTGGCDNLVKIWRFDGERDEWVEEKVLPTAHTDWVRGVAWAPSVGEESLIASCSQVRAVGGGRQPRRAPSAPCPRCAPALPLPLLVPNPPLALQDKKAIVWTSAGPESDWVPKVIQFSCVVWSVSWSTTGSILAVACADNAVTLWKEDAQGEWKQIGSLSEDAPPAST